MKLASGISSGEKNITQPGSRLLFPIKKKIFLKLKIFKHISLKVVSGNDGGNETDK